MCFEENKEIISEIHDRTIYPRAEDTAVPESPEFGQNLWVFC